LKGHLKIIPIRKIPGAILPGKPADLPLIRTAVQHGLVDEFSSWLSVPEWGQH
jgi:hypothetical protein